VFSLSSTTLDRLESQACPTNVELRSKFHTPYNSRKRAASARLLQLIGVTDGGRPYGRS
jgi:hypothetical protein